MLDLGCGVGEYVRAFARVGAHAMGCDVAGRRLVEARARGATGLVQAAGEALPYRDASFDVVVLNEVIEHVTNDRATMREVARILAPGGVVIIYAPNRLDPFETHGIYLGKRYVFGNIPLVNWLPRFLRDRLVPHARAYTAAEIDWVATEGGLHIIDHSYVYPGFDNVASRAPLLARLLRWACYAAEDSSVLRRFGLSHLVVLRKAPSETAPQTAGNAPI